jgi:hypothetical protein
MFLPLYRRVTTGHTCTVRRRLRDKEQKPTALMTAGATLGLNAETTVMTLSERQSVCPCNIVMQYQPSSRRLRPPEAHHNRFWLLMTCIILFLRAERCPITRTSSCTATKQQLSWLGCYRCNAARACYAASPTTLTCNELSLNSNMGRS